MIVVIKIAALGFVIVVLLNDKAYAYLDPGTASLLMNAALAAVVGAAVWVGECWARLRRLLGFVLTHMKSAVRHTPPSPDPD
jgi:hypothetical protein